MSVGGIFLILAALLFLLTALGAALFNGQIAVGLFLLTLGILLDGVPLRQRG